MNRGLVWHAKREYTKAIGDFDEAIRLNTKDALALTSRAFSWNAIKEYAKAMKDLDKAMRLDPKEPLAAWGRSVTLFHTRRPEAAEAFHSYLNKHGWKLNESPYAAILGHFAARQAGKQTEGKIFLKEAADKLDPTAWPYPIVKFLRGEIEEAALLKLATDNDKQTEARCYLGLHHVLKGEKKKALAHFRWVKDHGNPDFTEYLVAAAELERLQKPQKKPKP
jgi:lipoprotein NlpI